MNVKTRNKERSRGSTASSSGTGALGLANLACGGGCALYNKKHN